MSEKKVAETSEAQIAVHRKEEEYVYASPQFIAQAYLTDPGVYERFSLDRFPECFKEYADLLDWDQYWEKTLDTSDAPCWKWFVGGKINASFNCIDRHLAKHKNKAAILYVPEPEDEPHEVLTYQELYVRVNELAALLRDFGGVKSGDRVTIHMPMVPELTVTMLACARLGAIHSVVFGGFSGRACGERMADCGSRILVTMDSYYRNGKLLDHKEKSDVAVKVAAEEGQTVDKVLVWNRYRGKYVSDAPLVPGRDYSLENLAKEYRGKRIEPVSMPAEAPLFLMYTSGTTGKPKGCQHSIGGYLAYAAGTSKYVQDIHPEVSVFSGGRLGRGFLLRFLRSLDNQTLNRSAAIVVLSQDMAETLGHRRIARKLPIHTLNNFLLADFGEAANPPSELRKPSGIRRFIFAGNLGKFQNLHLLVEGLVVCLDRRPDVELLLLGEGEAKPSLQSRWGDHPRVRFGPYLPYAQAKELIAEADVGLVSLTPDIYRVSYPSKVLTYIGLGLPMLALVEPGSQLAREIAENGIGAVPSEATPAAVADAADRLLTGAADRQAVGEYHRVKCSEERILQQWDELLFVVGQATNTR